MSKHFVTGNAELKFLKLTSDNSHIRKNKLSCSKSMTMMMTMANFIILVLPGVSLIKLLGAYLGA